MILLIVTLSYFNDNFYIYIKEGVADVFPDIKFQLTHKIVEKIPPTPSSPTEVPSLVSYSVLDPLQPQEATAVVSHAYFYFCLVFL